jgi:hypothetical protein
MVRIMPDQTRREIHPCRKMTDGSLRQSCLAQALNEADAVLRPPERRRYPVKIAKPQRGIDLAQAAIAARASTIRSERALAIAATRSAVAQFVNSRGQEA